jgi:CubicO group peptidase (beta-lactamase class C family)
MPREAIGRAVAATTDRRAVVLASGAMSHTFWPLRQLRQHESSDPSHIFTPEARQADAERLEWFANGDHAKVIDTMPEFLHHRPEARFGHYLMMVPSGDGGARPPASSTASTRTRSAPARSTCGSNGPPAGGRPERTRRDGHVGAPALVPDARGGEDGDVVPGTALVVVAVWCAVGPQVAGTWVHSDGWLGAVTAEAVAAHELPGAAVAVVDQHAVAAKAGVGEVVAGSGRGVSGDTAFQAASLSKPVTALVAAVLAQRGEVDLDADVDRVLTSWRLPGDGTARSRPVTLRHLLSHTAGTTVAGYAGYPAGDAVPSLLEVLEGRHPANSPPVVADDGAPPAWRYSGGGFVVAQQALEDVTGLGLADLAHQELFEPLGLSSTTFRTAPPPELDVAHGHDADGVPVVGGWHRYPEQAAASLWTTAGDYARLVSELITAWHGGRSAVVDQRTAREVLDPDLPLGFRVLALGGDLVITHTGANAGYRSEVVGLVGRRQAVVVLTNGDRGAGVIDAIVDETGRQLGWPSLERSAPGDLGGVVRGLSIGGAVLLAAMAGAAASSPWRGSPQQGVRTGRQPPASTPVECSGRT